MRDRRSGLLVGAAFLLLIFAIDAALVMTGLTMPFDRAVLSALRHADMPGTATGPSWGVTLAMLLTEIGGAVVRIPAGLLGAWWLVRQGERRDAVLLSGFVIGGALALPLLKILFARPRPDAVFQLVAETRASFPSGHSMGAMLLFVLLGAMIGGQKGRKGLHAGVAIGIALGVIVGLTRIFLGVHWISDVIGGWAIGGVFILVALWLRRPRAPGQPG